MAVLHGAVVINDYTPFIRLPCVSHVFGAVPVRSDCRVVDDAVVMFGMRIIDTFSRWNQAHVGQL